MAIASGNKGPIRVAGYFSHGGALHLLSERVEFTGFFPGLQVTRASRIAKDHRPNALNSAADLPLPVGLPILETWLSTGMEGAMDGLEHILVGIALLAALAIALLAHDWRDEFRDRMMGRTVHDSLHDWWMRHRH